MLLTDTAGLRETEDEVEAIGVARAAALVEAADVLVWLGDPDVRADASAADPGPRQGRLAGRRSAPAGSIASRR